jgi:RNA polymerase sigma-70 factor, ECF subfamily
LRWGRLADYEAPEAWVRRVALRLAADRARRARRLPMGQRQAIVLHHLVGLTVNEVASQLRIPSGTVKTRLARGRAALVRHLEIKGEVFSNE